jgi:hypothetical protein
VGYERTVTSGNHTPAQAKMSRCSDPSVEMRKKVAKLKQKGCRFAHTVHIGNTYRSSWACPAHGGVVALAQVLTVTSDSSYEDTSQARFEDRLTRTKIVATRVGDCPPGIPGIPKHRPRPPVPSAPSGSPPSGSPPSNFVPKRRMTAPTRLRRANARGGRAALAVLDDGFSASWML